MGVYGDINGYGVDPCTLTIASASSVYVTGDVDDVEYLHVDGHLQANNVIIHNGVVHSERTLVVLGDITLYSIGTPASAGSLEIGGTCGTTSTTGRVELYGTLKGNGDLTVTSGVLNLARTANITLANGTAVGGTVTVNATTGSITQLAGTRHTMTMDQLNVNGTMNVPSCTIDCADINVGSNGSLTAAGATSTPDVATGGKTNIGTDTGTDTPITSDLRISNMTVKGQRVVFSGTTGTVTLTPAQAADTNVADYVVTANEDDVQITVSDSKSDTGTVTGDKTELSSGKTYSIRLVRDGSVTVTYTVTVTVGEKSTDASVETLKVKGVDATPVAGTANAYTVDLTYAEASSTSVRRMEVVPNSPYANLNNSINGGGMTNGNGASPAALEGIDGSKDVKLTITFTITPESGSDDDAVNYTVTVNVAKIPAVDASVELTLKQTAVDEGAKLSPNGTNAWLLVVNGNNLGAIDSAWLNARIAVEGTTTTVSPNWTKDDNASTATEVVFTAEFKGDHGGQEQPVTLTVRSADADERAKWDLEAIQAAFPNNGYATIGTVEVPIDGKALNTLKTAIEELAIWGSNPTVMVNFVADNGYEGREESAQVNIYVQAGKQSYTANVTVSFAPGT